MASYNEGFISISETKDGLQFAFDAEHERWVDSAIQHRHMARIEEIGRVSGREIMLSLIPDGTPGQVVDIMRAMIEEKDPRLNGWGGTGAHFIVGGLHGALQIDVERKRTSLAA